MGFEEVAIVCVSLVIMVATVALAYYYSELKKEQMRQYAITQRAQMKLGTAADGTTSPTQGGEWWQPIAASLLQNPQIQQMILQKVAPALTNATNVKGDN